jgi:hypothetical protein
MKRTWEIDPVVRAYMRDVDRSLLRENLKLTPAQRLDKLVRFCVFADELRQAGREARAARKRNSAWMSAQFDRFLPALVQADVVFKCVDLPTLIKTKRAAGRPQGL